MARCPTCLFYTLENGLFSRQCSSSNTRLTLESLEGSINGVCNFCRFLRDGAKFCISKEVLLQDGYLMWDIMDPWYWPSWVLGTVKDKSANRKRYALEFFFEHGGELIRFGHLEM